MVKIADRIKGHIMIMNNVDVSALPCMIGWGENFLCMIGWGARPCYETLLEEECLFVIG